MTENKGKIVRVSGPVIEANGMRGAKMYDVVRVGKENLVGEIIRLHNDNAIIQVYEDTNGLTPGEDVISTGEPLSVELGPGLITNIYDGIQRPLPSIFNQTGDFISRGVEADALDKKKKWMFKVAAKKGDMVSSCDVIGEVKESSLIVHKIMVPPNVSGTISSIVSDGEYTLTDEIAVISTSDGDKSVSMLQRWPVRQARPVSKKYDPSLPLVTGQRVIDTFFPIAKGGTAAIPGGFGTGKCVTGDTPVYLANGEITTMKSLYEKNKNQGKQCIKNNEEFTYLNKHIPVYSFSDKTIKKSNANCVYKGKTDCIYQIKTRMGRIAKVTPSHKLLTVDSEMNIKEIASSELKIGDYLVTPRKISVKGSVQKICLEKIFENERIGDKLLLKRIPKLITKAALKAGSKKALAQHFDMSYAVLIEYYLGRNTPTVRFVKKLSKYLKTSLPITKIKGQTTSVPVTIPKKMTADLAEVCGYIIGDGSLKKNGSIYFYNNDNQLRQRFFYLINELFGLWPTQGRDKTVKYVKVSNSVLLKLFVGLGIHDTQKANNCIVPSSIMKSPNPILFRFLSAYFNCDGYVGNNGKELELTTASKNMQLHLSYLLLRVGVIHSLKEKLVNNKPYYRVFIRGKQEISKFYQCCADQSVKFEKIKEYVSDMKRGYSAVDILPASSLYLESIYNEMGRPHSQLEQLGINTSNYFGKGNQEHMSVSTFKKFLSLCSNSNTFELSKTMNDVYYDKIIEIKKIEKQIDVYDITVPKYHNFIGGFGPMVLHNTITLHQLAKWSDSKVVVYVGCGERGNEMTDVLREFPELKDPKTGKPLMQRTVLIANTSNMPVAARDASVYTGMTIAEYYRDMGYDVALMADSTSRWAEAMREISGRLEEMPGEEGYPAYLSSRLAEFYERAGRAKLTTSKDTEGSITVMGAVSPPGGDFSEPVAQNTLRIVKVFWALDADLADKRHFPSINWLKSYSLYLDEVSDWWNSTIGDGWLSLRNKAMALLQKESELQEIIKLVGPDALPARERATLESARMIRENFLQQSAFHEVDTYCPGKKQYEMLRLMMKFSDLILEATSKNVHIDKIFGMKSREVLSRSGTIKNEEFEKRFKQIEQDMQKEIDELIKERSS
ncbi:MAG: V-type ATP synthase subunit A [Thermoplasmatota archaeon]